MDKGYVYVLTNPSFKVDWVEGGPTSSINCQMTCIECNSRKGSR